MSFSQLLNIEAGVFVAMFEYACDAVVILSADAVFIGCNRAAAELLRISDAKQIYGNSIDAMFGDDADLLRSIMRNAQDNTATMHELYCTRQNGERFRAKCCLQSIPTSEQYRVYVLHIRDGTERVRWEENLHDELRHAKDTLADIQSITKLGTWEYDLRTNAILWSDETFRLYGLEPPTEGKKQQGIEYDDFWRLLHPDDVALLEQAMHRARTNGTPYCVELRVVQPDGSYHFQEARGKAISNERGEIIKLLGTVRDINDDKCREQELLVNQERLENIINNISEIVVQLDFTGTIRFVSQTWMSLMGFSSADALNRPFTEFIHPDDAPALLALMMESLATRRDEQQNISYRVWHRLHKEWRWHNANAALIRNANGEPLHILATVRDVTNEKLVAEKLRRSEEFLSEAQKIAHLGSWYVDVQHGAVEWSAEMFRIFNHPPTMRPYTTEEFLHRVHPDDRRRVAQQLRRVVQTRTMSSLEFRIMRPPESDVRWLDARVKPVLHPKTQAVTALFGTIWDTTERKLAEEQIRMLNLHLEQRVQERTKQLETTNAELRAQIEERSRAEQALQQSQNNLQTLVESTADAIWSIDREYRFTTMNAAFMSILRTSGSDNDTALTIGSSALTTMLGMTADMWLQHYNRVLQCERFFILTQYHLAGYLFDAEISFNPILYEEGNVAGAVVFAHDISERLITERELREREALLNLILETVATGVVLADHFGMIIRVNRAFAQMLGYTTYELIGKHYTSVLPMELHSVAVELFQKHIQERMKIVPVETQLLGKDGSLVDVEIVQSVITNEANELYIVSSVNNITERKQAEEEIRRALEQERELSAMQSRFVVMVSHEFRTPLTTIRASAQLLQRNRDKWSPDKQQSYFEDIDTAVNTMTELLEDVLSWGKTQAKRIVFEPEPTDLYELLETIIDGFRVVGEYQHRLNVRAPVMPHPRKQIVQADAKLLRQILTNLISNALKYSPPDSSVDVEMTFHDNIAQAFDKASNNETNNKTTSLTQGRSGQLPLRSSSSGVVFRIADKGIGIAEEEQQHLFEPFYRAANVGAVAGTGLGLAIVRQAVELHGGSIEWKSALGKGTEFRVVIPCTFEEIP